MAEVSSHGRIKYLIDRLVEVIIVFIGVYAAFVLNAHQVRKQEQQRRHQILIYLEKQATTSAEKLREVTLSYDERMNAFLTQLKRGEMPEISPISWATNYNANETNWILHGGGLELLDIATIAQLKEVDSAASTGLSTMAHYQQLATSSLCRISVRGEAFSTIPAPGNFVRNTHYIQIS
jgi:hypothetical protein